MNVLTLDVETTISNKGNPFDKSNKLVCIGLTWSNQDECLIYWSNWGVVQKHIDAADLLVGFNIKFDLHWLKRVGIDFNGKKIWDCQIGEYILNYQKTPYPSLNQACEKYRFETKLDIVKEEYWNKGIDTSDIPLDILSDYLEQDLILTEKVFLKQREEFKNHSAYKLFRLQCQDLLVLQDMEYNGIVFNVEKANEKADELLSEISKIHSSLTRYTGGAPINFNSNDHISCLLYGGTIEVDDRVPVGIFKTGKKVGETRYKVLTRTFEFKRLVDPLEGSELAKEGYWSTSEPTLRSLKPSKEVKELIEQLLTLAGLEKLRSTYMIGYPKLIESMNWEPNTIHGTFNQCVAITGRLSSSKPNLQNADKETKLYMESRYME